VAISPHFSNDQIERFTRSRGGIIPYRILVGLDVETREMEEQAVLDGKAAQEIHAQMEATQARIAASRRVQQEAAQEKEEARRLLDAACAKQLAAERDAREAERSLVGLKRQHQELAVTVKRRRLGRGV